MKRLQTLRVLLERERGQRDEAQAAVRNALRNTEAQQGQLDGLAGYRADYVSKWATRFQQGAQIEILRSYQGFMTRLDQAITQQHAVVAHARRGVDLAKEKLLAREVRVATVERLIERRVALLARVQDRRDQKNLDEMAARRKQPKELAGLGG